MCLLKIEFQVLQLCSIDTENIKFSTKRSSSPTYMHLQRFSQMNKTKLHYDKIRDMITFFAKILQDCSQEQLTNQVSYIFSC